VILGVIFLTFDEWGSWNLQEALVQGVEEIFTRKSEFVLKWPFHYKVEYLRANETILFEVL